MATSRVTLIHNPDAGDEGQPSAGQIEALLKEEGYRVYSQSTKENGWQKALKRRADIIAVAGGDGTVTKVARRLIGKDATIAVLPLGTANNISKTLGIAATPVTQLIPSWKTARRLVFDAGIAIGPWGERHFIEGVGAGLLANSIPKVASSKTLEQLAHAEVKVSYAQQLFREHLSEAKAVNVDATLDGEDISGNYLLFEVMNMQYIGPNLFLAPHAARNSGEFDVVLVPERHREQLHNHIKHWQAGKPLPPEFRTVRGKRLEIRWSGFKLHIDDKLWPVKGKRKPSSPSTIELKVEPEALRFLVPKEIHEIKETEKASTEKGLKSEEV